MRTFKVRTKGYQGVRSPEKDARTRERLIREIGQLGGYTREYLAPKSLKELLAFRRRWAPQCGIQSHTGLRIDRHAVKLT